MFYFCLPTHHFKILDKNLKCSVISCFGHVVDEIFLDITQQWLVVTEVSGTPVGPIVSDQATAPIGYFETSVIEYKSALRKISEELRSSVISCCHFPYAPIFTINYSLPF